MTGVLPLDFGLVVLWGVVTGLDLVSVLQGLLSRPLVAASVAGWLMGNGTAGLLAGMVLELYALDVLPIGAARYPDWSVASVAGGAAAALAPDQLAVGLAGLVALPLAALGGWTLQQLRRRNAASVQRRLARVAAGDAGAIWELQRNGMLRDALRSFVLASIGVGAAVLVARVHWAASRDAHWLSWAVLAGGIASALGGALRSSGGTRRRWLILGLASGCVVVWLR